MRVVDMPLTTRARNILHTLNCETAEDVRVVGWYRFLISPNCGRETMKEIGEAIGGWPDTRDALGRAGPAWLFPPRAKRPFPPHVNWLPRVRP
jgi:hypothetical protein